MNDDFSQSTDFQVADELQQQLPRKLSLTPRGVVMMLVILVASIGLLALGASLYIHETHEKRNGAILAREGSLINSDEARISLGRRSVCVHYTFSVTGETYYGEECLPESQSEGVETKIRESGTLPILYLPGNPSINHPADWQESGSLAGFLFFLLVVVIGLLVSQSIEIRRTWKLARYGKAAVGNVTGYKYLKNGHVSLKYEFRDTIRRPRGKDRRYLYFIFLRIQERIGRTHCSFSGRLNDVERVGPPFGTEGSSSKSSCQTQSKAPCLAWQ
jgi:hypothetical protein